ncbi:Rrf2 family transcriptional regulator [Elioraea sp.]|uniref:RrF2 family transcriptional regulator n=1 Tax=Elioraea sp. TaxID=2185103 RepID=UPI0025B952AE|nr:Rrf2 family transcriptional regulator [Elioraea sp.]
MLDAGGREAIAVAAVVDVALHGAAGPVGGAAIAERLGQNPRGLEPLLQALSRAGILASSRGRRGGYRLARARRDISAGAILRALAEGDAPGEALPALVTAAVAPAWLEAREAALARLDAVTIEALARKATAAGLAPKPDVPITYAI